MRKIRQIATVGVAIAVSLFISSVMIHLFTNNTPTVKSNLKEYLAFQFKQFGSELVAKLPFIKTDTVNGEVAQQKVDEIKAALVNAPLKAVAKGTYAKTNGNVTMTIVNIGEMEQVQYTFTVDGKKVVITVPKELAGKSGFTEAELKEQAETRH